ncbi:MAG: hypothetical protein H6502_00920 [Candidatus Woesearchaeota archaeon]|nr:MAG: hypothetical protein H6502_00920 [Candidatus Woesearchaeota archaeon]
MRKKLWQLLAMGIVIAVLLIVAFMQDTGTQQQMHSNETAVPSSEQTFGEDTQLQDPFLRYLTLFNLRVD